ncbi:uncharacterized protein KQ657_003364 [Scheffersomyces spartinae]|uniref:ditrans,polycis-polyprenyl diphosphate synthase [(2E,6E)-farnesyldiphosphate specific] n=1 Tax=Scheffersomyces spartinae TaxID=45513 RepID=A0A9P7VDA1_9ASCO|nr:uncharacterized protein KQ657_003364 [Scheffersomyces spartinae]KAG7195597.1 hypothetical protein KQ657_003364 [Scheffersomyces spartinae]
MSTKIKEKDHIPSPAPESSVVSGFETNNSSDLQHRQVHDDDVGLGKTPKAPPNAVRKASTVNVVSGVNKSASRYRKLHPNSSPQVIREDVNKLTKIPKRLGTIINLQDDNEENGGVEGLMSQIADTSSWCLSAGIPYLSIYECTGVLTGEYLPFLQKEMIHTLANYFGTDAIPNFLLKIAHTNESLVYCEDAPVDLQVVLLSRVDGKPTIVELTRTMYELAKSNELKVSDITISLVDEELVELVGPEPDLLIQFAPNLDLQDYPPWQIRLSEIYWEPENIDVSYLVFIRALQKFSRCKMNVGK